MGIDSVLCVGEVLEDLICAICSDVLEDAKEIKIKNCEHLYCSICILQWIEEDAVCPQCRTQIALSDLDQPNRYIRNGLARLRFRCEFCEEILPYEQVAAHRASCDNNPDNFESCEYCSTVYIKIEREVHEEYCVGHLRDKIETLRTENEQLKREKTELTNESEDDDEDDDTIHKYHIEAQLRTDELNDISQKIDINEQLVIQLETTMANLDIQRKNYENQLNLLELKIREAEKERDLALAKQNQGKDEKQSPKIKEMESKLSKLRGELKQLQEQRKENEKLQRREETKSRQLQEAKNKLQEMKRQKVELIKKMRDEAKMARDKELQTRKEITQLKKNVRLKETNQAAAERIISSQGEQLQRKQREIQNLKDKIKSKNNE